MDDILSNVKIVIIGHPTVGKTSLRRAYLGEKFRTNYIETIGSDFSFKSFEIDEDTIMGLSIWDLAGQKKFLSVHPMFYKGSYGAVVVYSVVDRKTFTEVPIWIERFNEESNREKLPIMIIGNKMDIYSEEPDRVTEDEHTQLVEKIRNDYPDHTVIGHRTSALTGRQVQTAFENIARKVFYWIKSHADDKDQESMYSDDIDTNIPGAYAIVMNQIMGPQIISTVPKTIFDRNEKARLDNSAIKLMASLDFNDVIAQSSIISSFPWSHPKGIFQYIAFVLDNTRARGNKELFIIGININRDLSEPISGIKGVLNGFLHQSINEFARIVIEEDIDLVTSDIDLNKHQDFIIQARDILSNLRYKIHESLKRWYNIPS